jgi:hypothetical protein
LLATKVRLEQCQLSIIADRRRNQTLAVRNQTCRYETA